MRRRAFVGASLGALGGLVLPSTGRGSASERLGSLAVVVGKSSPLQGLTFFELKKLYLGAHLSDPSGARIVPLNHLPKSRERVAFDARVLGMSPEEVARYWIERKIRGQGGPPKSIAADLLQRVVSRLAHSLSYVRIEELHPDVRVIKIDGRIPGETGYALFT